MVRIQDVLPFIGIKTRMPHKRIFKGYSLEERNKNNPTVTAVIGCFTAKRKAINYAQDRNQQNKDLEHRVTAFESVNWAEGMPYEDFYKSIWWPAGSGPLPNWAAEEIEIGKQKDLATVILDW